MSVRKKLIIASALAGTCLGGPAYAQDAATGAAPAPAEAEPQEGLTDIVVTARKSNESLTQVPLAITAMTADAISNRGINDITQIAAFTPGLRFQNQSVGRNDRGFKQYVMRGIVPSSGLTTRQTVTVFVDGAPVSGGNLSGVTDLERVEVVKGPQSAFFGRSTFAGAINVVTRAPSYDWGAHIDASASRFGTTDLSGSVEGPIIADKLAFRVSARTYHTDGQYHNNGFSGDKLGERNTRSLSLSLLAQPTDNLRIRAFATTWTDHDGLPANARIGAAQNNCAANPASTAINYYCGSIAQAPSASQAWNNYLNPVAFTALQNGKTLLGSDFIDHLGLERHAQQYRLTADWSVGDWTVSAIGSMGINKWGFLQTNGLTNTTGIPNPNATTKANLPYIYALTLGNTKDQDKYGELRVSSPKDAPLSATLGINYAWARTDNLTSSYGISGYNLNTPQSVNKSDTYGVFGAAKWEFIDRVSISAEGRYQSDKLYQQTRSGTNPEYSKTFNNFSPRAILQFEPNRNSSLYASWSKGNRPGSFNTNYRAQPDYVKAIILSQTSVAEAVPEERIEMEEIGYKGMLFGNRLRVLAAAYIGKWTNRQVPQTVTYNDLSNVSRSISIVTASSTVDLSGIELEATFKATPSLTLEGTFSVADTEIKSSYSTDAATVTGVANQVGNQLPYYPKYSGSAAATYEREIMDGYSGYIRGDLIYTGRQYESEANLASTKPAATVNLRVGIEHDAYKVELFGTNIFDNKTPTSLARSTETIYSAAGANVGTNNGITLSLPDRASYGIRLSASF